MKIIALIFATLLFTTGCSKDWLDINTDPNNPSDASPEFILPNGVLASSVVVGGYYNILGGLYSQYWAQSNGSSQYRDFDSYTLTASDFETEWGTLYAVCLTDLRAVREKSEAISNWNLYLQATVIEAYTWQTLVDLYDKIPYFKALNGSSGVYASGYDDGDKIYDDLIIQLDKALAKDFNTKTSVLTDDQKKQDLIFKGDLKSWIAFANTLKLKIYLRQMYARPQIAQAGITKLITESAPLLTTDAKLDIFIDETNKDNPLYASNIRNLNTKNNLRSSSTFFKYLQFKGDSRFSIFCGPSPDLKTPKPMPQGGYELLSSELDPFNVSVFNIKPTTPVYFFTKAEVNFMLSEIAVIYGLGGDGQTYYNEGVKEAFKMYSLDGSATVASGGVYEFPLNGSTEKKQEAIMMQKWISMAGIQGIEMFFETNRTGYPKISDIAATDPLYIGGELTYSLAGTTNGLFPKRLLIPSDERAGNPNLPAALINAKITDGVWWDVK